MDLQAMAGLHQVVPFLVGALEVLDVDWVLSSGSGTDLRFAEVDWRKTLLVQVDWWEPESRLPGVVQVDWWEPESRLVDLREEPESESRL